MKQLLTVESRVGEYSSLMMAWRRPRYAARSEAYASVTRQLRMLYKITRSSRRYKCRPARNYAR